MKHNFKQRRENRINYHIEKAEQKEKESNDYYVRSHDKAKAIPFGQPILIGHHSEKRDRNYREGIRNDMDKSVKAGKQADYHADKADIIENNTAIFSDDPQALDKLKAKLKTLETLQTFMKAANKCIKKKDKEAFLKLAGAKEEHWEILNTPDCYNRIGFPSYKLTNNNANIKRIKDRIATLEKQANQVTKAYHINEVKVVENVEANRVQIFYPAKPDEELRNKMNENGFRFCKSEGNAWQRHLSAHAVYLAKYFADQYKA